MLGFRCQNINAIPKDTTHYMLVMDLTNQLFHYLIQ